MDHFTSVRYHNFKAFKNYSVSLKKFNVLVGPNNSGKSTILGSFRILSEGLKRAAHRKPEFIETEFYSNWGYVISLEGLPIATENVFHNYNDSEPASIRFRLSSGNELQLYFPEINKCHLFCDNEGPAIRSPSNFRKQYNAGIGFVPVLGPVDHDEPLYQKEAARLALLATGASRNFRNIWYYYPEEFKEFRELLSLTWPSMDIEQPELDYTQEKAKLHMFCPEERFPRELFWAGFGFQVWCQMLTFIVKSKNISLFIIDEPDIYLHSDLQRQLVSILKTLGPDILIATHSTEIISETEPDDLLIINKKFSSAKRIKDPNQLQNVFGVLGSSLNPTLTQLAKSKRVVFVEGKDFQILSLFARRLRKNQVANRSDFAVVPVGGFNAQKVRDFSKGIELTIGSEILKAVVFDRDYRSAQEVKEELKNLKRVVTFAWIHNRKEIENYLLDHNAIIRAINSRIEEQNKRCGTNKIFKEDIQLLIINITEEIKTYVLAQFLSKRKEWEQAKNPGYDESTINMSLMDEFEKLWDDFDNRMAIVPAKKVFIKLNKYLQDNYDINISTNLIISCFKRQEIPADIESLVRKLDEFRCDSPN